jgi:hypothetical protein
VALQPSTIYKWLAVAVGANFAFMGTAAMVVVGVLQYNRGDHIAACGVADRDIGALWHLEGRRKNQEWVLVERTGAATVGLRGPDGQLVELSPEPPSDFSLGDDDPRHNYDLYQVHAGDTVCAEREFQRVKLTALTAEEVTRDGLTKGRWLLGCSPLPLVGYALLCLFGRIWGIL